MVIIRPRAARRLRVLLLIDVRQSSPMTRSVLPMRVAWLFATAIHAVDGEIIAGTGSYRALMVTVAAPTGLVQRLLPEGCE